MKTVYKFAGTFLLLLGFGVAQAQYVVVMPAGSTESTSVSEGLALSVVSSEINANSITLKFNKPLGGSVSRDYFSYDLSTYGNNLSLTSASVSGDTLVLGLNSISATSASIATLHYTDPNPGVNDGLSVLQTQSGLDFESTSMLLTNVTPPPPSFTHATMSAGPTYQHVTLYFDGLLVNATEAGLHYSVKPGQLAKYNVYANGYGGSQPHYVTISSSDGITSTARITYISRINYFNASGTYVRYTGGTSGALALRTPDGVYLPAFNVYQNE